MALVNRLFFQDVASSVFDPPLYRAIPAFSSFRWLASEHFFEGLAQHQNALANSDGRDFTPSCRRVGLVASDAKDLGRFIHRACPGVDLFFLHLRVPI